MAIPNINKILEAQAIQRGESPESEESNKDEVMEILKLIFEYIKENNSKLNLKIESIINQEEMILKEIEKLKSGNSDNE